MPARPPDARRRQWRRRQERHPPACLGGGWLAKIRGLRLATPAANGDADGAGTLRGELQAPRGRHREPGNLGNDSAKAATKTLLEAGEKGFFVAGLDIDYPSRRKAGLFDRRREQIGPGDAPQHLAHRACGNSRCEECRGRAVDGAISAAGDLVQAAENQPASRQNPVNRGHSERQNRTDARISTFEARDAFSKLGNGRRGRRYTHLTLETRIACDMFYICSHPDKESIGLRKEERERKGRKTALRSSGRPVTSLGLCGSEKRRLGLKQRRHLRLWFSKSCTQPITKLTVHFGGSYLHEHVGAMLRPPHLLLLHHALGNQ